MRLPMIRGFLSRFMRPTERTFVSVVVKGSLAKDEKVSAYFVKSCRYYFDFFSLNLIFFKTLFGIS